MPIAVLSSAAMPVASSMCRGHADLYLDGRAPNHAGAASWLLSNVFLDCDLGPCPAKPSEKIRAMNKSLNTHIGPISDSGPHSGRRSALGELG